MTGPLTQLRALVALRWHMTRAPGTRLATVLGGVLLLWLLAQSLRAGRALDPSLVATAVDVAPAAYLVLGTLLVLSSSTSGQGQVVTAAHLVAYPLRPATELLASLLLAPLNLVWVLHVLILTALSSCLSVPGSPALGSVTTLAYVVAATVLGQLLAWLVRGLRASRRGRRLLAAAAGASVAASVVVLHGGHGPTLLQQGPGRVVAGAVLASGTGDQTRWWIVTGSLMAVTAGALALAAVACRWALQRPPDPTGRAARSLRRRRPATTVLGQLLAVDRASAWRAPALRRAAVVLAVLPGALVVSAPLSWPSLVALPGVVAPGAALLFGINAFSLDGPGGLWLASLPHDPLLSLWSKAVVLLETVLAAVLLVCAVAVARTAHSPTTADLAGLATAVVTCTVLVTTAALSLSVRHPHAADLGGPSDTVVPPGALVVASARIAAPAGGLGLALAAGSGAGLWWLLPALATPVLALCGASVLRTARLWTDTRHRSRVVHTVTSG